MFNINDHVIYGTVGVCKIVDIKKENYFGKEKDYYVLQPVYTNNSTILTPIDNDKVKLKRILTVDEVHDLIKLMSEETSEWIENDSMRKEKYRNIIRNGDREELVSIIKTLYLRRKDLLESDRKFHASDKSFMEDAEKIIHEEFAFVLNIKLEDVVPFIKSEMNAQTI